MHDSSRADFVNGLLGEIANPAAAHSDYEHDERVIALIARGIGRENTADIVKDRCSWLETVGD